MSDIIHKKEGKKKIKISEILTPHPAILFKCIKMIGRNRLQPLLNSNFIKTVGCKLGNVCRLILNH